MFVQMKWLWSGLFWSHICLVTVGRQERTESPANKNKHEPLHHKIAQDEGGLHRLTGSVGILA